MRSRRRSWCAPPGCAGTPRWTRPTASVSGRRWPCTHTSRCWPPTHSRTGPACRHQQECCRRLPSPLTGDSACFGAWHAKTLVIPTRPSYPKQGLRSQSWTSQVAPAAHTASLACPAASDQAPPRSMQGRATLVWPSKVRRQTQAKGSQILAVLSADALASLLPSGDHFTDTTESACPAAGPVTR